MRKKEKKDQMAPKQAGPAVPHPSHPESLAFVFGVLHQVLHFLQRLWEERFAWGVLNSLSKVVELIFRKTENLYTDFYT